MGIETFGLFAAWLANVIRQFILPTSGGLVDMYPIFGTMFQYIAFLWFLEGCGYIVRTIFGWEAADAAAEQTGRISPSPRKR